MVTDCQSEKRLYVRFSCKVTQKDWNRTQNAHAFLFNFREMMSKMREFVYFETIFVNFETPSWAKAGKQSPADRLVCGASRYLHSPAP